VFCLAGTAFSGPTLEELDKDPAKKKEIEKGRKALDKYFKAEFDQKKAGSKANLANQKAEAQEEFLEWLATTAQGLGTDLRSRPDIVIQMLDERRIPYLEAKFKKGSIEYVKVDDAKGMKRHEYAILVPSAYDPKAKKIPVVVSLHGRVINPRHPAFQKVPIERGERARETIWNNWFKTPAAELALVIAPTTEPNGFQFAENHQDDLQALYRTLGEALTEYRGDWDRIFLEVHGKAFRVACEQSLVFAGIIVRDRVDERNNPFLAPEHFFLLDNLNGMPLCYVADAANWAAVGKPMSDALTAAYERAGRPENLVIIQAQRDVDGALRGGEDKIKEFVARHERPKNRDKFQWRFFEAQQASPFPLTDIAANYSYDNETKEGKKAPLSEKAGSLAFEVKRENVNGQDINRIELFVTEAEGMKILLYDPLVNLDLPVTITVNGAATTPPIEAKKFERDWEIFFEYVLPRRFFMCPFLSQVDIAFPHRPQFQAPAPPPAPPPAPAGAGDEKTKGAEGTPAGGSAPVGSDGEKK
jgi:hypothetical protein